MKSDTVRFIPAPVPGQDGLSVQISPQTIVFKRTGARQIVKVYVDVFSGTSRIEYGHGAAKFLCGMLTEAPHDPIAQDLYWGFDTDDDGRFYYSIAYLGSAMIENLDVPFKLFLADKTYTMSFKVTTVADGNRGPALRGPMDWLACETGFQFQAGGKDDDFLDLVIYGLNCFQCAKNHAKTADNYPGSEADTAQGLWTPAQNVPLIISRIILAQYALVKNLGVETIDMRDAAGNILFQAKDGNVTCNTGTFENVVISGLVRKKKTVITSANFSRFLKLNQTETDTFGMDVYDIDFYACGTWLEFQYLPADIHIYPKALRSLCGNTILIYNKASHYISLSGNSSVVNGIKAPSSSFQSFNINKNQFASIEFKIGSVNDKETPYFEVQCGAIDNTIQ